jgi:hypothetical protein
LHVGFRLQIVELRHVGLGETIGFGIAAAVQIGLRKGIGPDRFRRHLRIHQYHIEMRHEFRSVERRRRERDQQNDGVQDDGDRQRYRQDVARSGRRGDGEAGG